MFGIALGGALAAAGAGATATSVPAPVPTHWVSYAALASGELQHRLSSEGGELVTRLHAWLEQPQVAAAHAEPWVVRIWISAQGGIERAEFQTLGSPQADADLRALLAAKPLSAPPPADMRQPLVLGLSLRANPDYVAPGPPR
ncbi:TonB C-terminal domain-containing protein [Xanthomonas sp.]|uniref:TonB C-terminal domain-containing protein n=1 Tax=Xanthomonas sp. TaxID=29446 RepID=UPI001F13BBD5|nr:TonB C-terminal domain-containing protein [Xanthomonas sp.]